MYKVCVTYFLLKHLPLKIINSFSPFSLQLSLSADSVSLATNCVVIFPHNVTLTYIPLYCNWCYKCCVPLLLCNLLFCFVYFNSQHRRNFVSSACVLCLSFIIVILHTALSRPPFYKNSNLTSLLTIFLDYLVVVLQTIIWSSSYQYHYSWHPSPYNCTMTHFQLHQTSIISCDSIDFLPQMPSPLWSWFI